MTVTTELLLQPPIGPVEVGEDASRRALPGEIGTRDACVASREPWST